jgi:hypothetical protein
VGDIGEILEEGGGSEDRQIAQRSAGDTAGGGCWSGCMRRTLSFVMNSKDGILEEVR